MASFVEFPSTAKIVAVVLAVTPVVLIENVTDVFPAGMVTVFGTVADVELLLSWIESPPVGATEPIVTVPVLVLPPWSEVGLTDSDFRIGPLMVRFVVSVTVPKAAVKVTAVWELTATVLTVKVALALPAGIVTVGGTVADLSLLESFTTIPPVPALPEIVTVPVAATPPNKVVGFTLREVSAGAVIPSVVVTVTPFAVAEIVADLGPLTAVVLTTKVAEVFPAGIVAVAGTEAEVKVLDNLTTKPPVGAWPPRVTVPLLGVPPATVVGFKVTEVSEGGLTAKVTVLETEPFLAVMVMTF